MNAKARDRTPSGTYVSFANAGGPYKAFVPDPLPPSVLYDPGTVGLLSTADRAIGELSGQVRTMANPHLLIRPFIRREAVLSSQIEGTETDIRQLYAYEAGQLRLPGFELPREASDVLEVYNYVQALEYGLERVSELPVSLRLIRELHERLLKGVRGQEARPGEFREDQNWIGPRGCRIQEAHYVPPPVPQMRAALDAFEKHLHADDRTPPLVRLALIHYQFEAIHPFVDGNGRIGRLLVSLLLVYWAVLPSPLLYLSAFFQRNRDEYTGRLRGVSEVGAWAPWIGFFLRGVATEAADACDRARRLQELQAQWRDLVTGARTSTLVLRLIDSLFEVPILTIPAAVERLGVTYHSAQRNVQKLLGAGIIRQVGDAPYGKTYVAEEILRILAESEHGR